MAYGAEAKNQRNMKIRAAYLLYYHMISLNGANFRFKDLIKR
jgi:phosphoribosyl-ATP pyrophosphohydrolase